MKRTVDPARVARSISPGILPRDDLAGATTTKTATVQILPNFHSNASSAEASPSISKTDHQVTVQGFPIRTR
jgi:hypothetical protein